MLSDMDANELAARVAEARQARRWSVETAARAAGINRVTWKRIENGLSVQDVKRRAVEDALGINGNEPFDQVEAVEAVEVVREQLNPALGRYTDHELTTEVQARMLLMASRLHAAGDPSLVFVTDADGAQVVTSRPAGDVR